MHEYKTLSQLIQNQEDFTFEQKFLILKNMISQLEKIHCQNKTYKYLCPENMYIDSNLNVTFKQFEDCDQLNTSTLNWAFSSPELLMIIRDPQSGYISPKADIWSVGLMLNVIFTMKNIHFVRGCVGFTSFSEYFTEIIQMCTKKSYSERPTSTQLENFLTDFENHYLKHYNYDMKLAFEQFKQERYISTTIKLQKLYSSDNGILILLLITFTLFIFLLQQFNVFGLTDIFNFYQEVNQRIFNLLIDQCDELEIKSSNIEFGDIKLEYKNFLFEVSSKNNNQNLYQLVQDKPLKISENKIIKADNYEIFINQINNEEGYIELKIKNTQSQQQEPQFFSFQLNQNEFISIGQEEENQIQLENLCDDSQLEILKKADGFYIKNISEMGSMTDSTSSIDSGNIYLKFDNHTPIFNQSIICTENQRYLVKSIS